MYRESEKGLTLVEMLLVIAILAILAAVTIIAINPARQLAKSRDVERSVDVYSILSAIHQYSVDNDGSFPEGIGQTSLEICRTDSIDCTGLYNLSSLTDNQEYLESLPDDPKCEEGGGEYCSVNGVGYFLNLTSSGKISVSAPNAELEESIFVTR